MEFHRTKSSMELHSTPNSMESPHLVQNFHGIPWNFNHSMELHANTKLHGIPSNPHTQCKSSMEFHGIWKVPWHWHQIPYTQFEKSHGIPWNYAYSMEFGTTRNSMKSASPMGEIHEIPENSFQAWQHGIELLTSTVSGQSKEFDKEYEYLKDGSPMGYSLDFHGNLGTKLMSPSSMEFHRTLRTPFSLTPGSLGLPWNSM